MAICLTPLLYIWIFVLRICAAEEKDKANRFLKSLPIKKDHIVLSRYIESILWGSIILIFSCTLVSVIRPQYIFNYKYILASFCNLYNIYGTFSEYFL